MPEALRPMLPRPNQPFPGWQPCIQAGGGVALAMQVPFWRGWAGGQGQGLLQCSRSVASATVCFFSPHTNVLMAMLHFSQSELRTAFDKFSKISRPKSKKSGSTKVKKDFILYAIYAVECGLKCVLLAKRNLRSTKDLARGKDLNHDLNSLLKKSEIDRSSKLFQRMQYHGENIPSKQLHELYRYGGQLDTRSENNLIENLSGLFVEIKDKLDQLVEGQYQP